MATGPDQRDADDLPVVRVSWNQAVEFCAVLRQRLEVQLRLPSDEEWEYAARSGTTTPFYWGKTSNGTESNCFGPHPYGTKEKGPGLLEASVVGSYAQVAPHPWNLVDLLGNVYEFCSDWMSTPTGISANKVVRGGTFRYNPELCRCAVRSSVPPDRRDYQNGFRLAADLSALA
jgi:formylglycine-generating enzyme required for sulfatase activity